jgi:hypothetical protein
MGTRSSGAGTAGAPAHQRTYQVPVHKEQCWGYIPLKSGSGSGPSAFITKLENLLLENFNLCEQKMRKNLQPSIFFKRPIKNDALISVGKKREAGIHMPVFLLLTNKVRKEDGKELDS